MLNPSRLLYTSVGYQLSKKCNANCDVCCESSSPELNDKIGLDIILDSIDSISSIKNIKSIAITGGEPFLYVDDVFSIAERCKKIERRFSVTTNAFWCESYSYTFHVLSQLKRNNLTVCTVSVDVFHQEYVPIECVRIFLRVCRDLKINVRMQTCLTKSTFSRTEEIITSLGMDKLYIELLYGPAYPVGTAKERLDENDFFTRKLDSTKCVYQQMLLIASDGLVRPCCSACEAGIPFAFGNIHSDSLENILENVCRNELMRVIVREGFSLLLEEAKIELGFAELNEYVNVCHLCNHLLADAERYSHLQKKAEDWVSPIGDFVHTAHW